MKRIILHISFFFLIGLMQGFPQAAEASAKQAFDLLGKHKWDQAATLAGAGGDSLLADAAEWYALTRNEEIPSFPRLLKFIKSHPDWPERKKLLMRAEIALLNGHYDRKIMMDWFSANPPLTERGKLKYAALRGQNPRPLIVGAWINGDFPPAELKDLLARYKGHLSAKDHIARINRLLWEDKTAPARSMLPLIPASHRTLFEARLALIGNKPGIDGLVSRVPQAQQNDPGLLFDRIRWRGRKGNLKGVEELLLRAPAAPPYPEKWWPYRNRAIREALEERRYNTVTRLAGAHGQVQSVELSEALWLSGWNELVFQRKPQQSYKDFTKLHASVSYPISLSRGAYWAARAAEAAKDRRNADYWYRKAAEYPYTFYGQLAWIELYGNRAIAMPKQTPPTAAELDAYIRRTQLARVSLRLVSIGADEYAWPFIRHLAENAKDVKEAGYVCALGLKMGRTDFMIRAAKESSAKGHVLTDCLFPRIVLPEGLAADEALVMGLARQESHFYPKARSSAGALGLMQVMPGTARGIASRHKLPYQPQKLTDPTYNLQLGSHYLSQMLTRFGGNPSLAAAAYNAGPSRPSAWIGRFGKPGGSFRQSVNWIEMIPYGETRNYVQRVLENYQVYRSLLSGGKAQPNLRQVLEQ